MTAGRQGTAAMAESLHHDPKAEGTEKANWE